MYARYLRLIGETVVLVSGSDEHGTPIEVEAIARGITPRKLTNEYHRVFVKSLKAFDIEFDNYTRTENPIHKRFVREFYRKLEKNGYIFTRKVVLPFCETDNRFLPDRFVEGECPYCHNARARGDQCDNCGRVLEPKDLIKPYCVICHNSPVLKESLHWFFDLPKLRDRVEQYISANQNFPENARNFSLSWIKEGLKPRSVTRDNKWGISAPFKGARNKTIYVWMEAVLGYVSATKEWAEKKGTPSQWRKFWLDQKSHNIHFIGKDNIPFHTVIFPALLLATGENYSLPWEVSSTEYIQFEGQRFSKSRKVGIWIDEALKLESGEYWRYALISLRPEQKDTDFTWEEFERKINTELNDVLGNFVHRTITFCLAKLNGRVPNYDPVEAEDREALGKIEKSANSINSSLSEFRLKEALEGIVQLAREGNRYLNDRQPWQTIKVQPAKAGQAIAVALHFVASIGILLQPFLPNTSNKILKSVFSTRAPSWNSAGHPRLKSNARVNSLQPLFHKVSAGMLREKLREIRAGKTIEIQA